MINLANAVTARVQSPAFWVVILAIAIALAANLASNRGMISDKATLAQDRAQSAAASLSLREGSTIPDTMGIFRITGERIQFVEKEGGRSFRCLENLMLQRVQQVIVDEPGETSWIVNGHVTEYRGENYLLIEMLKRTK